MSELVLLHLETLGKLQMPVFRAVNPALVTSLKLQPSHHKAASLSLSTCTLEDIHPNWLSRFLFLFVESCLLIIVPAGIQGCLCNLFPCTA